MNFNSMKNARRTSIAFSLFDNAGGRNRAALLRNFGREAVFDAGEDIEILLGDWRVLSWRSFL